MKELANENPSLEEKIVALVEQGNEAHNNKKYPSALSNYQQAWDLLPVPKAEWEMLSQWISSAFFYTFFDMQDYINAKNWAEIELEARTSDIDTGPLINLGMAYKELGQDDQAYHFFSKAYQYGKDRAFKERPKKYLDFYKKKAATL